MGKSWGGGISKAAADPTGGGFCLATIAGTFIAVILGFIAPQRRLG